MLHEQAEHGALMIASDTWIILPAPPLSTRLHILECHHHRGARPSAPTTVTLVAPLPRSSVKRITRTASLAEGGVSAVQIWLIKVGAHDIGDRHQAESAAGCPPAPTSWATNGVAG